MRKIMRSDKKKTHQYIYQIENKSEIRPCILRFKNEFTKNHFKSVGVIQYTNNAH